MIKAAAAAVLLFAAVAKEQKQLMVCLPGVHHLASMLIKCLEQPGIDERLRPALARLGTSDGGGGGDAAGGSTGGKVLLSYEQLLFTAYLLRWQANLVMLGSASAAPPELQQRLLPPGGLASMLHENTAGGRHMARLLPDCPVGYFAESSALGGQERSREAWRVMQRCREVRQAHGVQGSAFGALAGCRALPGAACRQPLSC